MTQTALRPTPDGHAGQQPSAPNIQLAVTLTLDTPYATGGVDFDAAEIARSLGGYDKAPAILAVQAAPKADFHGEWDSSTDKMLIRVGSTGAEVANTTDLSVTPGTLDVLITAQ